MLYRSARLLKETAIRMPPDQSKGGRGGKGGLSADFQTCGINSCFSENESWKIKFAFPANSCLVLPSSRFLTSSALVVDQ